MGTFSCLLLIVIIVTSILNIGSEKEEDSQEETREESGGKGREKDITMDDTLGISIKKAMSPRKISGRSHEKLSLIGDSGHERSLGVKNGMNADNEEEKDEEQTQKNYKTEFDFYVRKFFLHFF